MTYEEYRAARKAEEAEAEAKRKADREARLAAELAKTPEERQAELEAMPFEERYVREKMAERLRKDGEELAARISRLEYRPLPFETGHIGLGKIETADLRAVNDAIASAEFEPRRTWRDRILPPKPQRWFLWLMIATTLAQCVIVLIASMVEA